MSCPRCGSTDPTHGCGGGNGPIRPLEPVALPAVDRIIAAIDKAREAHTADIDRLVAKLDIIVSAFMHRGDK